MRSQLTFRLVDSPSSVRDALGLTNDQRDAIRSALADGGPPSAAHLVDEEWLGMFGIVGDVEECRAAVDSVAEQCGVSEFILPVQDLHTANDLITSFSPLAP